MYPRLIPRSPRGEGGLKTFIAGGVGGLEEEGPQTRKRALLLLLLRPTNSNVARRTREERLLRRSVGRSVAANDIVIAVKPLKLSLYRRRSQCLTPFRRR